VGAERTEGRKVETTRTTRPNLALKQGQFRRDKFCHRAPEELGLTVEGGERQGEVRATNGRRGKQRPPRRFEKGVKKQKKGARLAGQKDHWMRKGRWALPVAH